MTLLLTKQSKAIHAVTTVEARRALPLNLEHLHCFDDHQLAIYRKRTRNSTITTTTSFTFQIDIFKHKKEFSRAIALARETFYDRPENLHFYQLD